MPSHRHTLWQSDAREPAQLGVGLLGHVGDVGRMARVLQREIGECGGRMQEVF
jgi:hypothetical protein